MNKRCLVWFCVITLAIGLILAGCDLSGDDTVDLTGTVTIDKTSPKVGDVLTATYSGNGTGAASWQWYRGDAAISGASANTYTVVAADVGKSLKAQVSYKDQKGEVTSQATAATAAAAAVVVEMPALTGTVIIDNTSPKVGDRLTANYEGNGSGDITWEWFRGDTVIRRTTNYVDIDRYTVVSADVGGVLSVRVSTDEQSGSVTSAPTEAVVDNRPALTGTVSLSNGAPMVGDTITATYIGGNGTGAAAWQWFRGDTLISGTTGNTYTAATADVGRTLKAQVSYGELKGSVSSTPTEAVVNSIQSPPQENGPPPPQENGPPPIQETANTPIASLAGGIYTSPQNVSLSTTTSGASIYYTLDGSNPTTSSTQYTVSISISSTTTLKAIAARTGMNNSGVLTANYYIYAESDFPLGNGMVIRGVDDNGGVVVEMIMPLNINNAQDAYNLVPEITNKVYTFFRDVFDSIFIVLDKDVSTVQKVGFWGTNIPVSNEAEGIGLDIYDDTEWYGSEGNLKSVMLYPTAKNNYGNGIIPGGPTLHEYAHNWAAYIVPTYDLDNDSLGGHWGVSNAGGQLGGFKYVQDEDVDGKTRYQGSMDESFLNPGFGTNANYGNSIPYSDIELYLMGMKSASELPDNFSLEVYTGISTDDSCFDYNAYYDEYYFNGYFYATGKETYTIDELIQMHGSRYPDAANSQKKFRVLTVLVSENGSAEEDYQGLADDLKWFANMPGYENNYSSYNFNEATGGKGSLEVTGLKDSLK
jgi:hypothetical protein